MFKIPMNKYEFWKSKNLKFNVNENMPENEQI